MKDPLRHENLLGAAAFAGREAGAEAADDIPLATSAPTAATARSPFLALLRAFIHYLHCPGRLWSRRPGSELVGWQALRLAGSVGVSIGRLGDVLGWNERGPAPVGRRTLR
jgi:hypothetical protein